MTGGADIVVDLRVEIDYGQLYIYSVAPWADDPHNDAVIRALDDARHSGRWVGVADGLIDLVVPFRKSFEAPMRVEVWPTEPPADDGDWDQVVDVDFDVRDGQLVFEPSGGFSPVRCDSLVPPGSYRARVSGRGYADMVRGAEGMDRYRIRLWPRSGDRPAKLRRSWPGWVNVT
ncbi:MAG TPA: hypothetical protein VF444_24785 [Pseudonocardiaceae bacterium]